MNPDHSLAAQIRPRRKVIGLNQVELAWRSGVSLVTISRIENGYVADRGGRVLLQVHVALTEAERRWASGATRAPTPPRKR
jgi:predicted transcriptional regulator